MDETRIQSTLAGVMPDDVDPNAVVVTYDGDSDTLLIHFYGQGIPGVSVAAGDEVMIRLDRERRRVIGVHIEHFLHLYAKRHPESLELLDLAELRSVDPSSLAAVRRDIAAQNKGALLRRMIEALPMSATAAA